MADNTADNSILVIGVIEGSVAEQAGIQAGDIIKKVDGTEYTGEQLDVVSERLITLDGSPFSTLREFAENTKIEDEIGNWDRTIPERMEKLVAGYRYLADLYAKGIEVSGEEGDDCTQDIFIANQTDIEKNIWMLQAKLGKAPGIDA